MPIIAVELIMCLTMLCELHRLNSIIYVPYTYMNADTCRDVAAALFFKKRTDYKEF